METDGDELARRYEVQEDVDDGGPNRSEFEAMLQELSIQEAARDSDTRPQQQADGGDGRTEKEIDLRVVEHPQNLTSREPWVSWRHGKTMVADQWCCPVDLCIRRFEACPA
jgi:hypothetical protein